MEQLQKVKESILTNKLPLEFDYVTLGRLGHDFDIKTGTFINDDPYMFVGWLDSFKNQFREELVELIAKYKIKHDEYKHAAHEQHEKSS